MPVSNRDFVVQDLLNFFRSRCTNANLIKNQTSNVRHLCGYDFNLAGWRLLADTISFLPHIHAFGYGLRATDMDRLATVAQIADVLVSSRRRMANYKASQRTGRAGFLALDSERADT
ncbi:hypothetical protein [Bradyrhizobium sp. 23AC]